MLLIAYSSRPFSSYSKSTASSHFSKTHPLENLTSPSAITRRRTASFLRRGKRETREGHLRSLWLGSSKDLPISKIDQDSFFASLRSGKSSELTVQSAQFSSSAPNISSALRSFVLATTPFVSLRARRQSRSASKRPTVKIGHLSSRLGLRKALVSLTNSLQIPGASSQPFVKRFRRQLEPFSTVSANVSSMQEGRDAVHRQAFQALPSTWSVSVRQPSIRSK